MDCEYCHNRGGDLIPVRILRKRTYIFKPCPHCQGYAGPERNQLTLEEALQGIKDVRR